MSAGDDADVSIGPDIRFHQAILEASGNELPVPLGALIEAALACARQERLKPPLPTLATRPRRGFERTAGRPVLSGSGYEHVVRMDGIGMSFGNVRALDNVNFAVGANEIVGLLGDNGAGKSTLIKIMTGVYKPTEGRMYFKGEPIDFARYSVQRGHELGIETVYQDKSLGEKQPLWRNFFVGRQITTRFGFIDVRRQKEVAQDILLHSIGFRGSGVTVDSVVSDLSGGERQGIAIGRAMHFDADLIVLDEPTVALAVREVSKVLNFVHGIKESGRACVYIEHNLAHVQEIADRLVIIDRGEVVGEVMRGEMGLPELTRYLIDIQDRHADAAH